jgi:hypothetical protein
VRVISAAGTPSCSAPPVQPQSCMAPAEAIADAGLPREVIDILQQRGVLCGALLLLAGGPPRARGLERALQFQLMRCAVSEAAALLEGRDFAAVVVSPKDPCTQELEPILAAIAPRLAPGVLLVVDLPAVPTARPPGDREAAHLVMLRHGYDRVWVHSSRRRLRISARRSCAARTTRTCSIIVPVFNERNTFPELMRTLLHKRLDHLGLEREIILIESNSTDGTRELVAGFAATPGVRVLWQDRPRGKGHAVRAGLAVAIGDIVLIQDADLEYDVNDYDALLAPLLQERAAFVLGSRHTAGVGMRQFTDQRLLGKVLNAAHLFFTLLINILYRQRLRDPFTMFKVFRRDCLYGLTFECNRFDFDHELLIKLLLKGYRPLEVPVNYCSRSFKQGKKIRFFRDPPTWIAADVKYRLQRLRPRFE